MNHYMIMRDALGEISSIEDDKKFIQSLIVLKCMSLLNFSQELINQNRGVFIAPHLRQVHEYSVILIGLEEVEMLSGFINQQRSDRYMRDLHKRIDSHILQNEGRAKHDLYKQFKHAIYGTLSEHTHANVDNLVYFSMTIDGDETVDSILTDDAQTAFDLVEAFFLLCVKGMLNLNYEVEINNTERLERVITKVKTEKVIPNTIAERVLHIKGLDERIQIKKSKFVDSKK
jgi:hypothetical protein